jgi:hypothetical protein
VTKNKVLDLHKKAMERKLFFDVYDYFEAEITNFSLKQARHAQKIEKIDDVVNFANEFV